MHMADQGAVDRHAAGFLGLAEVGGQLGGFLQGLVPELAAADDDVGPGDILGVQPRITAAGQFVGYVFVLQVVFAYVNFDALG